MSRIYIRKMRDSFTCNVCGERHDHHSDERIYVMDALNGMSRLYICRMCLSKLVLLPEQTGYATCFLCRDHDNITYVHLFRSGGENYKMCTTCLKDILEQTEEHKYDTSEQDNES
jgi:hypothetical protein